MAIDPLAPIVSRFSDGFTQFNSRTQSSHKAVSAFLDLRRAELLTASENLLSIAPSVKEDTRAEMVEAVSGFMALYRHIEAMEISRCRP